MARKGLFSSIGHAAVIATVAAMALTAIRPAVAGAGPSGKGLKAAARDATDFSARRRYHHGGHRAAAVAGAELVSPQNRRAYDDGDYYECSPVHCGPNYKRGGPNGGYGTPIFVVPSW